MGKGFFFCRMTRYVFLQELATPGAFARNPSRVWEFYHYRRELMLSKHPNPAHIAIAECEKRLSKQGRSVVVITQNIDELHRKAGTKHLLEIHGKSWLTSATGQETWDGEWEQGKAG